LVAAVAVTVAVSGGTEEGRKIKVPQSTPGRSRREGATGAATVTRQWRARKTSPYCLGSVPVTGVGRRELPARIG